jgi:cytochrome c-type biogenesis protein CcmF
VKLLRIQKQKLFLRSISQKEEKNYRSIIGQFITVQDSKGKIENLLPELRIYNQPNITTSEADIKTTLLSDKFMVINISAKSGIF